MATAIGRTTVDADGRAEVMGEEGEPIAEGMGVGDRGRAAATPPKGEGNGEVEPKRRAEMAPCTGVPIPPIGVERQARGRRWVAPIRPLRRRLPTSPQSHVPFSRVGSSRVEGRVGGTERQGERAESP